MSAVVPPAPTASRTGAVRGEATSIQVDGPSWQQGYDAGLSAHWSGRQSLAPSIDRWSWVSGYIEGDAARLKRGSQATRKLDANREY